MIMSIMSTPSSFNRPICIPTEYFTNVYARTHIPRTALTIFLCKIEYLIGIFSPRDIQEKRFRIIMSEVKNIFFHCVLGRDWDDEPLAPTKPRPDVHSEHIAYIFSTVSDVVYWIWWNVVYDKITSYG